MSTSSAVTFAVLLPALLVAHQVADYWVQTDHQAAMKGQPGWVGRLACLRHVTTYTAVTAGVVGLVWWLFDLQVSLLGFVAGQVVSAVSHYWADRRTTLDWFVGRLPWLVQFHQFGQPRQELRALTTVDHGVEEVHLMQGFSEAQWDNPGLGTGAHALDQSWHAWWLFVAALVTAVIP